MDELDNQTLACVRGGNQPDVIEDFSIKHDLCSGIWREHRDHAWGTKAYSKYMTGCLLRDPSQPSDVWVKGVEPPPRA